MWTKVAAGHLVSFIFTEIFMITVIVFAGLGCLTHIVLNPNEAVSIRELLVRQPFASIAVTACFSFPLYLIVKGIWEAWFREE